MTPPLDRRLGVALRASAGAGGLAALSGALLAVASVRAARMVVVPGNSSHDVVSVLDVDRDAGVVSFEPGPELLIPGRYGFRFRDEKAMIRFGPIVSVSPGAVVRRLEPGADEDILRAGDRGYASGWFHGGPAELGPAYTEAAVTTPAGRMPAWEFPAESGDGGGSRQWAILVHGWESSRHETLRAVPVLRAAGYTCLSVSYRNDPDAPPSADRRYGLGSTEWPDVAAAIRHARDQGARRIVLVGWSMGAAVAFQTLLRAPEASLVHGLVVDSPVLDWRATVRLHVAAHGLPLTVADGACRVLAGRRLHRAAGLAAPIDLAGLDIVARADELTTPVLLMHSDDDAFVPSEPSHALARRRPDLVRFEAFARAGHARLWNYDERRWADTVTEWLSALT